jgi:uncharacterized membrane protein YbhN (UPF0104 family)
MKKIRRPFSIIVVLVVIAAIVLYLWTNDELLFSLAKISLRSIFWLILLRFFLFGVNGLFLRTFAAKFGVHLVPKEWFGLSVITIMGNYLTPFSGGLAARAGYLKLRHKFPYAQFATLLASNYLVNFWVVGIVGILTLLFFVDTAQYYWQIILFFLIVTLSITLLVLFPSVKLSGNYRTIRMLNTSLEGWSLVKGDNVLLSKLVIYTVINIFLNGLSFWVAYQAIGYSVSFAAAVLVGLLTVFSILLNITPGNLGVSEAVISLSSGALGVGADQGLLVALLLRATTIILAFTLGPIFSYLLAQGFTENHQKISVSNQKIEGKQ